MNELGRVISSASTWARPTARSRMSTRTAASGRRPTSAISRCRNWSRRRDRAAGDAAVVPVLAGRSRAAPGATRLPWNEGSDRIVGEFARLQGAKVPSRLVSSAKSWLCHAGIDREADILPWGSPPEVKKVSPVEASAVVPAAHPRRLERRVCRSDDRASRLENQEVVLTVPASFDEAARELTIEAAKRAELATITLLEEPQAAFYCWIVSHQDRWQREVRAGELILVCDIGGGTTDFSLITVVETPTGPGFRRVAVGDHLMLGGDNIDLALAHHVEKKLGGVRLDAEQWSALRFACRTAKEKLLGEQQPALERWPVTIAGRGSKLIGGSIQSELTRAEVEAIALDGFFPRVGRGEEPQRAAKIGLQEFGLPFVADPAVPKHLSYFLRRHRAEAIAPEGHQPDGPARAARRDPLQRRSADARDRPPPDRRGDHARGSATIPGPPFAPRVLTNISLDLAVAQGAAYYGVVRRGGGIRIGGGTARSFYVGLETAAADKPWLCVVPRDAQEGEEITIAGHDFDLLMGQPVVFPLASSSVRPDDKPGALVRADPDSIRELPPLQSLMRVSRKAKAERVPGQPGGARDRGRHDRALVPVAHRRSPLAAPDPAPRPGRPARGRGTGHRRRVRPGRDRTVGARRGDRGDPRGVRRPARRIAAVVADREAPGRRGWSSGSRKSSTCRATSGRPRRFGPSGIPCSSWPKDRTPRPWPDAPGGGVRRELRSRHREKS